MVVFGVKISMTKGPLNKLLVVAGILMSLHDEREQSAYWENESRDARDCRDALLLFQLYATARCNQSCSLVKIKINEVTHLLPVSEAFNAPASELLRSFNEADIRRDARSLVLACR